MYVHTLPVSLYAANFPPTSRVERAVAAQQTAEARRKLMKVRANLDEDSNGLDTFMIGESSEGGSRQPRRESQSELPSSRRLQRADEEQASEHLSFWA